MCGQVKLAYQESEVVALLKKIPLNLVEMSTIRERAEQLRDGSFCDYRPVLPLMLASFIFDVLCTPGESRLRFDMRFCLSDIIDQEVILCYTPLLHLCSRFPDWLPSTKP